jgi:hypothetical protein
MIFQRKGKFAFWFHKRTSLGLTLWRKGGVSLQFRGHFFQAYVGDWMAPVKGKY